jgi:hypothetical protein
MAMSSFQRKVLILGVCIAVLAGTYILGLVFSPARVGRREAEAPLIAGFERQQRDRVAEIRIRADEGERILIKKGDSWILPGAEREYPASATRIDALLDFLADLARTRIVTSNPEAWEEFQVGAEAAKRIQLFDSAGDELTEIIIGKSAAGGEDNYVRLGGSNEIVLTNRSFDYYLNVEERFWAYLRIFPEDLEGPSIMRITIDSSLRFEDQGPDSLRYTLVLSSGQPAIWTIAERSEVELDNSKVDLLANNLADLEGSEFAHGAGDQESGLAAPAARVLLSTVDGRDFRLLIGGDAGDQQYYATLENGSYIYKVSAWRIKGILKDVEDLRAEGAEDEKPEG